MGTDCVVVQAGLLVSVAVNVTMNVCPAWALLGVNVKTPVEGLNAMFDVSPEALNITGPAVPVGSFPEIVKRRFPPNVAFCGPGTVSIGSAPTA